MKSYRLSAQRDVRGSRRSLLVLAVAIAFCSCRTPLAVNPRLVDSQTNGQVAAPQTTTANDGEFTSSSHPVESATLVTDAPCPAPSATAYPALPPDAFTGRPGDGYTVPGLPGNPACEPTAGCPRPPWAPPGIARPWPLDEYLCDGGDRYQRVGVGRNFQIGGLDMEDTVVHYDTLDNRRLVQPSNRVCIYAPRFAAVRQIVSPLMHDQQDRIGRAAQLLQPYRANDLQVATTAIQPVQPIGEIGTKRTTTYQQDDKAQAVDIGQAVAGYTNELLPHENFEIIKTGHVKQADKPRLSQAIDAAQAWTTNQAVQVTIDNRNAVELGSDTSPQSTYEFHLPPGKQRVRICKVASKDNARPGDIVDFTLRFDNVGDQRVGNVTVIDNLTPRLEYVPGSAQCSVEADFSADENDGQSLVLRWEVIDPLEVGDGGIIRFKCRVR